MADCRVMLYNGRATGSFGGEQTELCGGGFFVGRELPRPGVIVGKGVGLLTLAAFSDLATSPKWQAEAATAGWSGASGGAGGRRVARRRPERPPARLCVDMVWVPPLFNWRLLHVNDPRVMEEAARG